MECPRNLPPDQCCAITKRGSVFVHKINTCRAAVAKGGELVLSRRVAIRKSDDGGQAGMTTDAQRINIRKVAWELIKQ